MANHPLGWISPKDRTREQNDAHAAAVTGMVRFSLPVPTLVKGQAVRLFDAWKDPTVVKEVGFTFDRIHQLTGSCVWAGGTNAVFTTIAMQRVAKDSPTKAFMPFTLHNYAMSRHYMGDDGQGEGSLGSTFWKSLTTDGVTAWTPGQNGMPSYNDQDGVSVTSHDEMVWSSIHNPALAGVLKLAKPHVIGATGECNTVQDIKAMLVNGYGVGFACDNFIGNASIRGEGSNARVMGSWDGQGGHQQSIHAVEEHPDFGTIYWAQNNWPGNTYPRDPSGGPVCGCWVLEDDVEVAMRLHAEVYGYSHLSWFPAAPSVLDWSDI